MCNTLLAALLGLAAGCGTPPVPADLLAPADPRVATRWHPPASPTAGLKHYKPVDARSDWGGALPPATDKSAPGDSMPGMAKPDTTKPGAMPGMDMPGMRMPGRGGR